VDSAGDVYVAFLSNGVVFESSRSLQDFGDVNLAATSASIALPFTFDSPGTLGSTAVLTQGTAGLDFANNGTGTCAANTSYMTGQTCTVNVAFTPQFAGTRFGAAVLKNTSGAVIATGYVQGTGVGPQVDFLPGRQSTIATAPGWTYGVAVDAKGNVFFADNHNGIIYSASPSGGSYSLSTIPTSSLSGPYGLTVDGSGSLYIVDTGNYRVLKETPSAGSYMESTIASFPANGGTAPTGVAVDGSGNVFIVNAVGTLYKETLTAGSYSQSTIPTGVSSAAGVAVDGGGNVFVAINSTNGEILKETPSAGGYVQSVIAVPSGGVPSGVSVDAVGNLYVNYTVTGAPSQLFKETPSAGGYVQTTIPITGLDQPFGVTVDALGNVYIADSAHQRILKLDFADPPNLTFASTAVGSISSDSPQAVTVENIGNADLSFPIPSTGNNPSVATDFTLNSSGDSACPLVGGGSPEPGALAGAASCELSISFTPAVAGTVSGSLVLTDNNLNAAAPGYAAQSIELSGTGTAATPIITWAPPAAITYGTALSTSQLNATASVAGTFTFNPALGTVPPAGTDTLTVTFTPTDSTDYTTASASVSLTVGKATPMITWPTPAPITYGTALSAMQLNATANVPGTLAYSPALGAVVPAGSQILSVVFTPTDTNDYYTASKTVPLTVNKAILIITWHAPAPITYGAALSATQLNATAGVAGTFTYSPALGTVPPAGTDTLTVTFTPTDSTDYTTASASVSLTVGKATPMITWPTPAPITYGTALSATQLNASANVPGSFAYNPAAGTIPPAGTDTLTVTFTPADTKDYATVTASVSLTVSKPTPSFTLSALSASLSVAQNSSGSSTISVTDVGGFTGSVKLSASGMPSGVTASFGTNPTAKTSVLTLKASAKAATGAVSITITGTSGSLTRTTSIALTVVSHK
jgi:streptogramin lyase